MYIKTLVGDINEGRMDIPPPRRERKSFFFSEAMTFFTNQLTYDIFTNGTECLEMATYSESSHKIERLIIKVGSSLVN